jgi:hypothetical protein
MAKMLLRRGHKPQKAGPTVILDIFRICAPYSFVCSCFIHLSMAYVARGALTIKEKDKAADRLFTSGYVMLYYAAAQVTIFLLLFHATSFFRLTLINCYICVYNFQSSYLR